MDGRTLDGSGSPPRRLRRWLDHATPRALMIQCGAGIALLAAYHLLLRYLMTAHGLRLGAVSYKLAPLYAYWRPHVKGWLFIPLIVLGCYWVLLRRTRLTIGWFDRRAVVVLTLCFGLIATAVAMLDGGPRAVVAPLRRVDLEYFGAIERVDGVARFLREYPSEASTMPMHAQVHPPGAVLFLWWIAALFGTGMGVSAAWMIGFSCLSVPIVYCWAGGLAGPGAARRAAVFLCVTPSTVLFVATSMDGPFAVFLMATMWLFWESLWRGGSSGYAFFAGLAATAAALMTYSVTVALLFCAVAWSICCVTEPARRRAAMASAFVAAGTFVLAHAALWIATGYDPIEMFRAAVRNSNHIMSGTRHESIARYVHIAVGNLVVFFIAAGLPCAVIWWRAACRLSNRFGADEPPIRSDACVGNGGWGGYPIALADAVPLRRFLGTSLITLLIAAAVPVYVLEVERVWLFLVPLVIIPVAAILADQERGTGKIGLTMAVVFLLAAQTVLTEVLLTTYW